MLPILPFAAGIVTGMVALRLFKSDKAKAGLTKARGGLREVTLNSLEAIESVSARARGRLAGEAAPVAEEASPLTQAGSAAPAPKKRAPAARRRTPGAAKTAARASAAAAKDDAS